jgi:predicted transposase/invertase (TIGR01784 family)
MAKKLVRFDWAMKKMLRHKANFDILEGFLSELLGEEIKIKQILDSESNKETEDDKYNRVDILVEFSSGELVIIEIQDNKEYDYFHRILFGTSKVITEHIKEGEPFAAVKKVISITIAYFDLGQGKDYVYHGTTSFKGLHEKDILTLSEKQIELYKKNEVYEIYPEYWLIKVGKFSDTVNDKLDEWIYFFKNAEIRNDFSAKGLKAASERLVEMKLDEKDQIEYKKYLKHLHEVASGNYNKIVDAQDLINKGKDEKVVEAVIEMNKDGVPTPTIAKYLKIPEEKVIQIIESQQDK